MSNCTKQNESVSEIVQIKISREAVFHENGHIKYTYGHKVVNPAFDRIGLRATFWT